MVIKPNSVPFELADGHTVPLCLNFELLYMLKSKSKRAYNGINSVLVNGTKDVMDYVTVIYACYLCGKMASGTTDEDTTLTEMELIKLLPSDFSYVSQTVALLLDPKKRTASDAHLRSGANESTAE